MRKGRGISCLIRLISKTERARTEAYIASMPMLEMCTQRSITLFPTLVCIHSFNKYSGHIYYMPGTVAGPGTQRSKHTDIPVLMELILCVWNVHNSLSLFLIHEYSPWPPNKKLPASPNLTLQPFSTWNPTKGMLLNIHGPSPCPYLKPTKGSTLLTERHRSMPRPRGPP